ncbi:MAG: lipolytic enzyme, G-D-S-L [Clostridium sp.]|nr:GDSL-type esterase/lipase family protein [Clostridium sp.]MCF0147501.1 lipolytic enzyme, G-D-S-L [Clostridium sp.]
MKKTILCFGDSNTHGYNSSNNGRFTEGERWTCLLSKYLGENYSVKEEGLSGRTTVFSDPLFEGLDGISYISPCLLTHEPIDLLIIMLGTNDTKERFSATPENIAKGLERLTQKAISTTTAWRGIPNILLIAPLPIEVGYENTFVSGEMGKGCAEKSKALASLYKEVAERNKCHFLDSASIDGMSMYPYDYMHLSKESHELLACKLSKLIPDIC